MIESCWKASAVLRTNSPDLSVMALVWDSNSYKILNFWMKRTINLIFVYTYRPKADRKAWAKFQVWGAIFIQSFSDYLTEPWMLKCCKCFTSLTRATSFNRKPFKLYIHTYIHTVIYKDTDTKVIQNNKKVYFYSTLN